MKFYPSDWRAEPRLKLISRAARSLWLDMIGLMFDEGTGRLEVDGKPMTIKQLADTLGDNPRTTKKLLAEIESAGVSSKDQHGFIYSRRLIDDFEKAEKDKANGRMGGNPALKTRDMREMWDNPPDNPIPETRSQKPDYSGGGSAYMREGGKVKTVSGTHDVPEVSDDERCSHLVTRIVSAVRAGSRNGEEPAMGLGGGVDRLIAKGWCRRLGLTDNEIVDVVSDVMRGTRSGIPNSFKYFTKAMQRHAEAKHRVDDVQPIKPRRVHDGRSGKVTTETRGERSKRIILAAARGTSRPAD